MEQEKIFWVPLSVPQPSQLYINEDKLEKVKEDIRDEGIDSMEPIPVKRLEGDLMMTDGHTRAVALCGMGYKEAPLIMEQDELDWEAYRICLRWCIYEGITEPCDLTDKVVDDEDYDELWLERCHRMQKRLEEDRKK